jgi:hypothetical protein
MKDKQKNVMFYSFICPPPCNRKIRIKAKNNIDDIDKMIMAGAISCRNSENRGICEKAHVDMPPIPLERLKNIVSLYMREKCEA